MISPGFVISVLATLFAALVTGFLVFEDWAVWSHPEPPKDDNTITAYTRQEWRNHPHFFLLLLAGVCLLIGHFMWH